MQQVSLLEWFLKDHVTLILAPQEYIHKLNIPHNKITNVNKPKTVLLQCNNIWKYYCFSLGEQDIDTVYTYSKVQWCCFVPFLPQVHIKTKTTEENCSSYHNCVWPIYEIKSTFRKHLVITVTSGVRSNTTPTDWEERLGGNRLA